MGLSTIVAFLSFFVAMIALWLASDVVKRVESQNEKFLHAHLKNFRKNMKEMSSALRVLETNLGRVENNTHTEDQRINEHTKAIDEVSAGLAKLRADTELFERSIPQRYRNRTIASKQHDNGNKSVVHESLS